jgi:hypothetical protein
MPTFQELHAKCVQHLFGAAALLKGRTADADAVLPALKQLIAALPYYKSPDWMAAFQGAIANVLMVNLPDSGIPTPPNERVWGGRSGVETSYTHSGPSNYRSVFFVGIGATPSAELVTSWAQQVVNGQAPPIDPNWFRTATRFGPDPETTLNRDWWARYSIAALTDAIRTNVSGLRLNGNKLDSDLARFRKNFAPALSASFFAVFQKGCGPTADALSGINSAGQGQNALSELKSTISHDSFTKSMQYLFDQGGESALSAEWFLYNLWITLKALDEKDPNAYIRTFESACPNFPRDTIGAGHWWNGKYTSWCYTQPNTPPYGSALLEAALSAIAADMPLTKTKKIVGSFIVPEEKERVSVPNGYARSLCENGPYKP